MMIRVLSLLLAVQLVLTVVLYWPGENAPLARPAMLLDTDRASVTAISISDTDGNAITLTLEGTRWRMPSNLPADSAKVATLLDALLTSDPGFAIARSESAAKRFEVGDNSFERKIELQVAGETRRVFLGSSPAFRKVHARLDGENAVYVVDFNSYDAPTTELGWLDRSLLAMRSLERVTLDGSTFALDGGRWLNGAGEPVDAQTMESLLTALAGLQVSGISGADNETATAATEALRIEGVGADGRESVLSVLENSEAELYYLRGDAFDGLFNTSSYDAERLLDAADDLRAVPAAIPTAEKPITADDDLKPDVEASANPKTAE